MEHAAAEHHAATFTDKQKKLALLIVAFAFVMDLLDSTIVNIAIPSIQANLGASYAAIQWLIAGYSLTFALLLITGGRMGDVIGYKKIFMIGVSGFTIASFLAGIAPNTEFLVGARLIQGAMAALMVPQVMSLMQVMYKPAERAGVMGLFGMLGGLAASLGPIIGGLLIKANLFGWDWRPIFLINLPVGIVALLAGMKYLPEGKSIHPLHLDLKGTALIIVAFSLLIFPLIEGRELDWPMWIIVMLALSIPALIAFAWYEIRKDRRDKSALIVPTLFKIRTFATGLGLNILVESVMLGYFLTVTLVMQIGLGYSPIKAALTGIPTAVGMTLGFAVLGQKMIAKFGRNVILIGATAFTIGLVYVTWVIEHFGLDAQPLYFTPGLLLLGVGLSLVMIPIFSAALQDVDAGHAGSASGILSAVQQVGGAIGIAIIGVIFFGQLDHGSFSSFDTAAPQLHRDLSSLHVPAMQQDAIVAAARQCYHDRSAEKDSSIVPDSCKQMQPTGPANETQQKVGDAVMNSVKSANAANFSSSFRSSVVYTIVVLFVICILSVLLPRKFRMAEHAA